MPQMTIYIRRDDVEAWKSVIKKSEFIHNALQDRSTYDGAKIVLREDIGTPLPTKMPKTLEEANDPNDPGYSARVVPDIPSVFGKSMITDAVKRKVQYSGTCPNGHILQIGRNKCSQKGCKYAA